MAGQSVTTACADQLCADLKAGVEGDVHADSGLWAKMDELEEQDFLVIVDGNALNLLSCVNMLWNVRHLWLGGARFAFNLYCFTILLICQGTIKDHLQM